jgi:hypothetical protein
MDWPFKRTPAERKKETAQATQRERLDSLLANGNEEDFVAMVKAADPNITPEKLSALIENFRQVRRERALGGP